MSHFWVFPDQCTIIIAWGSLDSTYYYYYVILYIKLNITKNSGVQIMIFWVQILNMLPF